jgi:hypothetical protein
MKWYVNKVPESNLCFFGRVSTPMVATIFYLELEHEFGRRLHAERRAQLASASDDADIGNDVT